MTDRRLLIIAVIVVIGLIWGFGNLSDEQEIYLICFGIIADGFILFVRPGIKEYSTSIPVSSGATPQMLTSSQAILTSREQPTKWKQFKTTYGISVSQDVQTDRNINQLLESMDKGWNDYQNPRIENIQRAGDYWLWRTDRTTENGKYGYWRYTSS